METGGGGHAARSGISPILANVFLHYVVDLWVRQWRGRRAVGQVIVCRYADDSAPRRREEEALM